MKTKNFGNFICGIFFVKLDILKTIAMRQLIILLLFGSFFSSCVTQTKVIETSDPYKKVENAKLIQYLTARSADQETGLIAGQNYPVSCTYLFEEMNDGKSSVTLEIKMETPISTDPLDSVAFLNLDGEKFRMVASERDRKQFIISSEESSTSEVKKEDDGKVKTQVQPVIITNNYQLMSHRFIIPESLWVSIANTEKIKLRIYLGKEGYDIRLNQAQTDRLKLFFQLSICKRDAKTPPLPEGYKKW